MSGAALEGRTVLVVERDDARAGRLIMALRMLGAKGVRWSDDDKGRSQARAVRPEVVLLDASGAEDWVLPILESDPSFGGGTVVRIEAKRLWAGDELASKVLEEAILTVAPRGQRETKPLRAVGAPKIEPPKLDLPPEPSPKVEVAPSIAARRVASVRSTEKYGAVAADVAPPTEKMTAVSTTSVAPPPVLAPEVLAAEKSPGYVFPTRRASDLEDASSSKATSLDLTAVPSAILERASLPDTDRFERAAPSRMPWVIGIAVVLSVLALIAAYVTR